MKNVCKMGMVWYGMVEVCEGAPVAVSGWVLTDRHDVGPCAASSLLGGAFENAVNIESKIDLV